MRIDLTVVGSDGTARDVAVEAPGSTPVADVARALGVEAGDLAAAGGSSSSDLASSELRSGAIVPTPPGASAVPSLVLTVTAGEEAGRVLPLRRGRIVIGRSGECALVLSGARVSRRHAELVVAGGVVSVRDLGSAHGTLLDEQPIGAQPVVLAPNQVLRLGDAELVVRIGPERGTAWRRSKDGRVLVRRSPRELAAEPPGEIAFPQLPPEPSRPSLSFGAVLPALGGIGFAAALGSPLFLAVSALSPAALLVEAAVGRLRGRGARRRAAGHFRDATRLAQSRLEAARSTERAGLRQRAPDVAEVARLAAAPGRRLWERRPGDADALCVRLGLAATQSRVRARRGDTVEPPADLGLLPRQVDLAAGPLGITGPERVARALARWVVVQLAVFLAPTDLRLVLFCSPRVASNWRWARWLPHLDRVAITGAEQDDAAALLASTSAGGRIVAIADDVAGRVASALCELAGKRRLGVVLLSVTPDDPPAGCWWAVNLTSGALVERSGTTVSLQPDAVSDALAESVARDLAPLEADDDTIAALPARCSLRTLLGLRCLDPAAVAARWRSGEGRLQTPLGTDGRSPVVLDLQRDGPHALVAGTTGSGKSELLRTLVLGLAAGLPPDALQFLLFDFKGGATFAGLARLPHTVAVLSDLDASGAARALRSLESELQRRERFLAAVGVPDLDRYPSDRGDRPPRLLVVIDEFAALAAADERLLPGLVSVAQRGRSLGFHLVLATQRPGACVSADLRANTNVRIALRTVSAAESADVIDVPDAAGLDPRRPGLALLRTGAEAVLFQTAGAGVAADAATPVALSVTPLDDWRRPVGAGACPPDPEAAVAELVEAVRTAAPAAEPSTRLWLPPLAAALPAAALLSHPDPFQVPWALVDLPEQQRQTTLSLDLMAGGGVLLSGGPGSGRSTALAALAVTAAARLGSRLHLHVVDPAGSLSALSRLSAAGTVTVGAAAVETMAALIEALRAEVATRARSLGATRPRCLGAAGSSDVRGSGIPDCDVPGRAGDRPAVLLLVDGWEDLCAAAESFDAGRCADLLLDLMRSCSSTGVTVVLAGDRASLAGRVTGAATRRFVLPLADRADYGAAGVPTSTLICDPPPGRAVRVPDGAALQFGFVGPAPHRWVEAVDVLASDPASRHPADPPPLRLRELPPSVRLADIDVVDIDVADPAAASRDRLPVVLGLGGTTAAPLAVDLGRGIRALLVAGPARSGRSTVLMSVLTQLGDRPGIRAAVVAPPRSPLSRHPASRGLRLTADGEAADDPQLVLVDDCEHLADSAVEGWLLDRLASPARPVTVVASVRSDQLALSYRGLAAELRQVGCALLLQPSLADAQAFGIALPRVRRAVVPGRGILVADPAWKLTEPASPVQVALP